MMAEALVTGESLPCFVSADLWSGLCCHWEESDPALLLHKLQQQHVVIDIKCMASFH